MHLTSPALFYFSVFVKVVFVFHLLCFVPVVPHHRWPWRRCLVSPPWETAAWPVTPDPDWSPTLQGKRRPCGHLYLNVLTDLTHRGTVRRLQSYHLRLGCHTRSVCKSFCVCQCFSSLLNQWVTGGLESVFIIENSSLFVSQGSFLWDSV